MQFVNRHIHFTRASLTCTCVVIAVKDAASYSSKPTRSQKPNIKEHCNRYSTEQRSVQPPVIKQTRSENSSALGFASNEQLELLRSTIDLGVVRRHVHSAWYPQYITSYSRCSFHSSTLRLRDHVAQDACRHCTLKSSTSSATSCLSLLRPTPGLTSRKRLCPHSRKYHSVRLLVPLRTGVDEACEQRRPEEGLHT